MVVDIFMRSLSQDQTNHAIGVVLSGADGDGASGLRAILLRVLREGIAGEVRAAVQRSIRENIPATATAVLIDQERGEQHVQIDVLPSTSSVARARSFLVLFQPQSDAANGTLIEQMAMPQLTLDEETGWLRSFGRI